MDSIKKVNEKALNFLHCVQTACNNHRIMIEDIYKGEHSNFVNHWRKPEELKLNETESVKETSLSINIEELCLADDLLQRARHVRMNLEKPKSPNGNGIAFGDHKPSYDKNSKTLARNKIKDQNVLDSGKLVNFDVQHKTSNLKLSAVQCKHMHSRKKSTSSKIIGVKLPKQTVKGAPVLKLNVESIPSSSYESKQKSSSSLISVIVSGKELSSLKNLHLPDCHLLSTYNSNKKEVGASSSERGQSSIPVKHKLPASAEMSCKIGDHGKKAFVGIPVSLDCQYMPNHVLAICRRKKPTENEFRAVLKGSIMEAKPFQPHIRWSWYPFLNTANESVLCQDIKCNSIHELEIMYVCFHKIQETMLWLDFITLLHREISPYLQPSDQIDRFTLTVICNIHKMLS